jgi:phosphatidylserine/phosphatidylglycerophosphate/cardiolipin synthase-like enzyme
MIRTAQYLIKKLSKKLNEPFDPKDFLSFLEINSAIRRVKNPVAGASLVDYEFQITTTETQLDALIAEYVRQQELELVVTYPSKKLPAGWQRTRDAIKKWFRAVGAGTEILIIMPILQSDQVSDFLSDIEAAIKNGAVVQFLTLPTESVFKDKMKDQEKAIAFLSNSGIGVHHLRDLWFHAKIICFGETASYIGSANWTEGGFRKNLEMGVIIRGERARSVFRFFKSIMD